MKKKIIIFGSGVLGINAIQFVHGMQEYEIAEIWDNAPTKWGMVINNMKIIPPHGNVHNVDKIVICCEIHYDEMIKQLVNRFDIAKDKIVSYKFCWQYMQEKLIENYERTDEQEIQEIIAYIKKYELKVFNYKFADAYKNSSFDIEYDSRRKLYFAWWNGKRMYLSRKYDTVSKALNYIRSIAMEQDEESPHRYLDYNFRVNSGDVIVDAGAAEGFFTLDVIDIIEKSYLIENDRDWIEALKYTFEDFTSKIVIVEKFLSEKNDANNITLDYLIGGAKVNFIKLDLEGTEAEVLGESLRVIANSENIKIIACSYHNKGDGDKISSILKKSGLQIEYSKGYMFFNLNDPVEPHLRRGLVRAIKRVG